MRETKDGIKNILLDRINDELDTQKTRLLNLKTVISIIQNETQRKMT